MKKIIVFIVAGIIIGGLAAYGIIRHIAIQRAGTEIAQLVLDTPSLEEVRYGKISIGLIQSTFGMQDIQLKLTGFDEPIRIDRILLDAAEAGQGIPHRARAEIKGIQVSTRHGLLGPVRTELEAMGYRNIAGLISLAYTYDNADKILNLNDVTIRANQMGSVRFDLSLTNLDLDKLVSQDNRPDVATMLMAMPMAGLAQGRLTYADDSFLKRALQRTDTQDGGQPETYHFRAKEKLGQLLKTESNDRVRQMLAVLVDFIDHPESITISLKPTKPVPFLRLLWVKKIPDILDLLNATISK